MKRFILPIVMLFSLSACNSTWPDEEKKMFYEGCVEDIKSRGMNDAQAKAVCDCRIDKLMKKYPDIKDLLENMQSVVDDPEVKACDEEALKAH